MALFGFTIFSSAFLLFLVQPLIARIILPWFGGSASVWTTCLMFFQTTLLIGYLYAHASVRLLKPKAQAVAHTILLLLSLAALPILPNFGWKAIGPEHPIRSILLLLAATVGMPYLLLSTTGPILQAWYARWRPASSPYRLYAVSNAGSLLALIAYPALFEPLMRLGLQAYIWSGAYVLFVAMCTTLAWLVARRTFAVEASVPTDPTPRPAAYLYLLWAALPFCPAAMLGAVSTHITQNVAPVPLLWVVPLGLYLLSFILTFDSPRWYGRRFWFPLFFAALGVMLGFLFPEARDASARLVAPIFLLGFFICAVTCHGELYRLRPAPQHLTAFYLMISLGGALGGFFVAVIAPLTFRTYLELPVALLAAAVLITSVLWLGRASLFGPYARIIEFGVLCCLIGGYIYLLAWQVPQWLSGYRFADRNFYGALRVQDIDDDNPGPIRQLTHGTILHGSEFMQADMHRQPTTYYGPDSGVGLAIASRGSGPRRIGVVGLGTGTITAYARPGDVFRFYEINPMVVRVARNDFYFLRDCPGKLEIVLGDARLSMEHEPPENYDVLAIDAFSGDSVPVHLLTVEACREYFRHLKADGILAIHISNKYLRLLPIVAGDSRSLGKPMAVVNNEEDEEKNIAASEWVLLANSEATLSGEKWKAPNVLHLSNANGRVWTDDYSNMLAILKY